MKLLLDQNISRRIVPSLSEVFPESTHVAYLEMSEQTTDKDIWQYALDCDYAIVTLDADFHELALLYGAPPLVIWLKCGNQRKEAILDKIMNAKTNIEQAGLNPEIWCLEIY